MAPHWLAVTTADAAVHLTGKRRDPVGLAVAGATAAGLGYLIHQARRDQHTAEDALREALGADYVDRLETQPTPAELATPWRSLVNPFRTFRKPPVPIRVERNIAFGEAGRRNHLDIYLPEGDVEDAPVLLQVHGGAWTIGDKGRQGLPLMARMAARGWVCVAINYRLAPRNAFPAQIVDVKRALAWIREHIADYGGDPGYVAVTGGSAGGHLAALAAVTPNDPAYQPGFEDADTSVQVAVPHYGVYDLAGATGLRSAIGMRDGFLAPRIMQARWSDDPDLFEAASPLLRVTPDAPDFFVLHGTHDTVVSVEQARLFVSRLREVSGGTVVYAEMPGAQHAYDVFASVRCGHVVRAVDRFLHWHWNGYRAARGAGVAASASEG
jgi:acetyl esterase/lipase